jgi:uncharacterized glyoxalase superfamily protein PhnB
MADPFEALRLPVVPLDPRPEFGRSLRRQLAYELGLSPTGATMTVQTDQPLASGQPTRVHERFHVLTPYIAVHDARAAIAWYTDIFGATGEGEPYIMDDGRIGHAELRFGDSVLMLADEFPELDILAPPNRGGTSTSFSVYVPDVDATYQRALDAGATAERPPEDQFYGSRSGWLRDPFGHRWSVQTPLPDSGPTRTIGGVAGRLGYYTFFAPDVDRAAAFYGGLFGWTFEAASPTPDGVHHGRHISNTPVPMGVNDDPAMPSPNLYYRVDDLEAMVAKVRELGGEVLEVEQHPSGGNAHCRDDQGVEFQLWQPAPGY